MTDTPPEPGGPDAEDGEDLPPTPFSFKLVVVLGGLYLLWRLVQLVLCIPSLFSGTPCPWM